MFLFTNIAYPSNLRVSIDPESQRAEKLAREAAYLEIAEWIDDNSGYKTDTKRPKSKVERIIKELRNGRVIFKISDTGIAGNVSGKGYDIINFRRGVRLVFDEMLIDDGHVDYTLKSVKTKKIPEEILKLVSETLGLNIYPSSIKFDYKLETYHLSGNDTSELFIDTSWITSRKQLWNLKPDEMTEEDIGKCLRSLGRDVPDTRFGLKKAIKKKLIRLVRERGLEVSETINKKALELIDIDEDNFKDGFGSLVAYDYIKNRDMIKRETDIKEDSAIFYYVLDIIINLDNEHWSENLGNYNKRDLEVIILNLAKTIKNFAELKKETTLARLKEYYDYIIDKFKEANDENLPDHAEIYTAAIWNEAIEYAVRIATYKYLGTAVEYIKLYGNFVTTVIPGIFQEVAGVLKVDTEPVITVSPLIESARVKLEDSKDLRNKV